MSLTVNKRELFGPLPQEAHWPGFQYVNEVSGSIEPYRAMPLLAISNTLNANGLATSAPKFWGNSCSNLLIREGLASGTKPRKHCFVRLHILDGRIIHPGVAVQRSFCRAAACSFPPRGPRPVSGQRGDVPHSSRAIGSGASHPVALLSISLFGK